MDLRLPDIHGVDVTRKIRTELGIDNNTMPIIAVTAYSGGATVANCFEAGMDDYMTKPLQMKTLEAMIDRWLVSGGSSFDNFVFDETRDDDDPADLDLLMLENFIGFMGKDRLHELFSQFCADYDERYKVMLDGTRGATDLRGILHPLISTSASMGLARLSACCREIMDLCQDDSFQLDDVLLSGLNQAYEDGIVELRAHINTHKNT